MRKLAGIAVAVVVLAAGAVAARFWILGPRPLVLTGIVTTDDVLVSPQLTGRIERLLVSEGDAVAKGQLLAVLVSDELAAEREYFAHAAGGATSQVQGEEASVRHQKLQSTEGVRQAQAALAAAQASQREAEASAENARLVLKRTEDLFREGVAPAADLDTARTSLDAAQARVQSLAKQSAAAAAALSLARSSTEQVAETEAQLGASREQQAAAEAERRKADVRLGYAEIHAPIAGVVDVRVRREGEVVTAGEPIVALVNPDDLWVRADVEETYIDRVRLGDKLTVRLPSGEEREGTVFHRGVDAGFATQRDVSRTKRDIKTFEVRLRVDNADRRLAVGMTATVLLPVP